MTQPVQQPTGTIGFERKVGLPDYGNVVASIYVPFEVDFNDDERTLANARDAFAQGKSLVLDELGLKFSVDEGGYVRELLERNFGQVRDAHATEIQAARPAATQAAPSGNLTIKKQWSEPVPEWVYAAAAEAGVTEVWDNRAKLKSNGGDWKDTSPWFKSAGPDGTAFWPPKDNKR